MLSFFPQDVLDEIWDSVESFLRVFLPTLTVPIFREFCQIVFVLLFHLSGGEAEMLYMIVLISDYCLFYFLLMSEEQKNVNSKIGFWCQKKLAYSAENM